MSKKLIVIVGAGPGIGNHVARRFGAEDFRVVLMARRQDILNQYVEKLKEEGIEAYAQVADAASTQSLSQAFEQIKAAFGTVDVLVYNAAILEPNSPTSLTSDELLAHYQVDVANALHCVNQVLPEQSAQREGTILLTGCGLALYPSVEYTTVSMDKAALRALAVTLGEELKDKGIFVGTVTITGAIAPNTYFAPELIAEKFWALYQKRKEHEIVY